MWIEGRKVVGPMVKMRKEAGCEWIWALDGCSDLVDWRRIGRDPEVGDECGGDRDNYPRI